MATVAGDPPDDRRGATVPLPTLTPDDDRILAYASAIGREFDFDLLVKATGADEEALSERLEHLVHEHVLRERVGGDRFAFVNEEFRVRMYQSLTASRLRVLHRKVAEALEALHPRPAPEVVTELGRHYFLGKVAEKSYSFNRKGAVIAREGQDPETTALHLERVRIDLTGFPGDRGEELADLDLELGDLYYAMGDDQRADRLYLEGLDQSAPDDVRRRARFLLARAEIAREHLQVADARRLAAEAQRMFEQQGDLAGVASVRRILGRIHFEQGEYQQALEEGLRALDYLQSQSDERTLGRLCTDIGNAFAALGPRMEEDAAAWYGQAIRHLESVGDWLELARAHHNLGVKVGETMPQVGLEHLEKARQFSERSHDMRWTAWSLFSGVEMRLAIGQIDEAERDNQQALRLLERVEDPMGLQQVAHNRGLIAERRGDWEQAEGAYREALERADQLDIAPEVADSHFALARLYYKLRDLPRARVELEAAERSGFKRLRPARAPALADLRRQLEAQSMTSPTPTGAPATDVPVRSPSDR
jgi:tetratricopeptide (TPR) repeat protein